MTGGDSGGASGELRAVVGSRAATVRASEGDADDRLLGELVAMRPHQTDALAGSLRASVLRRVAGGVAEPFRLGRFTVLGLLGGGGMGVVFLAYDPDLDRKIALKVLHSRGERGRRDVLREGRALARLKHANVVAVYDVGEIEDDVFVAMEYVEGVNLRAWLKTPRGRAEVLARLLEAGRGLAAAHAASLVHRDCKPENLVVDAQGHARVIDFGLARLPVEQAPGEASAADSRVTTVSLRGGTPGYMAPECLAGAAGDARSDQYAFCVTCWEALFGARPGQEEAAGGRGAPGWLRRVLERGLAAEPERRWPSMAALLSAMQADPTRRWRIAGGVAAVGLAVAGGFAVAEYREAQRVAACEAEGSSVAEVWDAAAATRLRDAMLATRVGYAESSAARVVANFDAYAAAWQAARTESCLDARVRGVWDADTLDRATWCLDGRRMEFAALVAAFTEVDAAALQNAVTAAAGLSQVGPCRDERRLAMLPAVPAGRDGVTAVLRTLSRARALRAAGKYEAGLTAAEEAEAAAQSIGWAPLVAAAVWRRGDLLERAGKYPEAEAAFERAYFTAARVGALETAADATVTLVWTVGNQRARTEDGFRWAEHAEVVFASLGVEEDALLRADLLSDVAVLHENKGAYAEAQRDHERALAITERVLGPDHPQVAVSLNNLGNALALQGANAEARAAHARALEIRERALGPDHPDVAQSLNGLGYVAEQAGAYAEARARYERALAIRTAALGPDHPDLATTLNNLAGAHELLGEIEEAKALHRRALGIRERALGPDHPHVANSLNNLAQLLDTAGEHAEATPLYARALAIRKQLGPEHPKYASTLFNFGNHHMDMDAYAEAKPLFEQALAIWEKTLGPEAVELAHPLTALAKLAIRQDRPADAVALAERAVRVREAGGAPPEWLARSRYVLGRALWAASTGPGPERERALALVRQAIAGFDGVKGRDEELATMKAYLAERAGE